MDKWSPSGNELFMYLVIEWLGARLTQVTFSGRIFFPSKVSEFLRVLFNLTEKYSSVSFFG